MLNRKLSAAFETWQSNAAQMKVEGDAMRCAVSKMVNSKLAAAMNTWCQTALDMQ